MIPRVAPKKQIIRNGNLEWSVVGPDTNLKSDMVLLSGGTSKGRGDLCYRVVAELNDPGIVVHGVALKPGKPICMAVTAGKPVVILPGFPTSAIFTFHEFVAPVIRLMAGRQTEPEEFVSASMAIRTNSEVGRTEYLLVGLVHAETGLSAQEAAKRLEADGPNELKEGKRISPFQIFLGQFPETARLPAR